MKITHPLLTKSLGLFGATAIRALTATLDYRIIYADPFVDPVHPRRTRHAIYLLWHEYLMFPLGVRGKKMTVLISQHRDGELITQALRHLGFRNVRGSSTRGGVAALRRMLKMQVRNPKSEIRNPKQIQSTKCQIQNQADERLSNIDDSDFGFVSDFGFQISDLILTPDGPRGPRRRLAEGSIFLASRLQMPIVCMGFAFERPWRQKSWDRFAVPRPFSRARAVISGFIDIPPNLQVKGQGSGIRGQSEESGAGSPGSAEVNLLRLTPDPCPLTPDLEYWRLNVERTLNQVTEEAERWAESGRRKPGEMPLLRHQPAPQMARPAA